MVLYVSFCVLYGVCFSRHEHVRIEDMSIVVQFLCMDAIDLAVNAFYIVPVVDTVY